MAACRGTIRSMKKSNEALIGIAMTKALRPLSVDKVFVGKWAALEQKFPQARGICLLLSRGDVFWELDTCLDDAANGDADVPEVARPFVSHMAGQITSNIAALMATSQSLARRVRQRCPGESTAYVIVYFGTDMKLTAVCQ